jgi:hypothetical protein
MNEQRINDAEANPSLVSSNEERNASIYKKEDPSWHSRHPMTPRDNRVLPVERHMLPPIAAIIPLRRKEDMRTSNYHKGNINNNAKKQRETKKQRK